MPSVTNCRVSELSCVKWRYIFVLMAFLGAVNIYALRVNISVALVDMVNQTYVKSRDNNTSDECTQYISNNTAPHNNTEPGGRFDWDPEVQGLILSSFYYGYFFTQLLGGLLAKKFSAMLVFGLGVFVPSLLAVFIPLIAAAGPYWLVAIRVLQGLAEGVTMPAMFLLISRWMPPLEVTRATGLLAAGFNVGTVLSMVFSGLLCKSSLGWPAVFYVSGAGGTVWFIAWLLLIRDGPSNHPYISEAEKHYIRLSHGLHLSNQKLDVPWKQILFSRAVLPYYYAALTGQFIFVLGLASYPTYMTEILHYDIVGSGVFASLPHVCSAVTSVLVSFLVDDVLRKRGIMSTTTARKFITFLGQTLAFGSLMGVSLVGCDRVPAVSLLVLSSMGGVMTASGYDSSSLDMAPNHVGVIYGVANTLGTIPGMVAPSLMGILTNNAQTIGQWMKVFLTSGCIVYSGTLIYVFFGTNEVQAWNDNSKATRSINEDLGIVVDGSGYGGYHDDITNRPLLGKPDDDDDELLA